MSDTQSNDPNSSQKSFHPHRRRTWPWFLLAGVIALGAFTIPRAIAFVGAHGWGHGGPHGVMSPEALSEHMSLFANHMLDAVDATDDQRADVQALLDRVAPDMVTLHDEAAALKEALHAALEADDLDVDEIEALQAEAVGLFDRGTSLALDSFVELHSILTPEQREQIRERMEAHGGRGRGHGPGFGHDCPHGATPEQAE